MSIATEAREPLCEHGWAAFNCSACHHTTTTAEQGTRGFVECSNDTGCGGRWTWNPAADLDYAYGDSWNTEAAARAWADTHLNVCDGPVRVVVTHRDGEPVDV